MPAQSVRFDTSGEHYTVESISVGSAFTISCWVRLAVDRNTYSTAWGLDNGGTSSTIALQTASDGTTMRMVSGSGDSFVVTALDVGTWYSFTCVRTNTGGANGSVYCWWGTAPDSMTKYTMSGGSFGQWSSQSSFNRLRLGESQWGSEWLNGNLAAVKVWTRALSDQEVADELAYYEPQTTSGLYAAWLFWDGPSTADASGNGRALSGGSGTSAEPGPGIPLSPSTSPTGPRPRLFLPF